VIPNRSVHWTFKIQQGLPSLWNFFCRFARRALVAHAGLTFEPSEGGMRYRAGFVSAGIVEIAQTAPAPTSGALLIIPFLAKRPWLAFGIQKSS